MNAAVDATVFLLLLGAAVAGLVAADAGPRQTSAGEDRADDVANVLATSTASVDYSLAPGARRANGTENGVDFARTPGPEFDRTARGSLAGLLARAAVGTAGFDGAPVTHARDDLRRAVREAIASRIPTDGLRVDAVWRPYPDAPVGGRVAVGESPPDAATVDTATLAVPTGVPTLSPNETRDFASLSAAVAARTVSVLAPPGRTRLALRGDALASATARRRYARLDAELGVTTAAAVGGADTRTANRRLAAALRPRIESDLRARYDSPADAAAAVSVAEVRIAVRTWDAAESADEPDSGVGR